MAAPVLASFALTPFEGATSIAATAPAGIQAGDLLIGAIGATGPDITHRAPADWTKLGFKSNSQAGLDVYYRVATSSDAAATSYTFTKGSTRAGEEINLLRLTGADTTVAPQLGPFTSVDVVSGDLNTVTLASTSADYLLIGEWSGSGVGTWTTTPPEMAVVSNAGNGTLITKEPRTVSGSVSRSAAIGSRNVGCLIGVAGAAAAPAQTISPVAIATVEAFGAPTVTPVAPQTLSPVAIATAEALGLPTLTQQAPAQTLSPVAIPSAEALGTPALIVIPAGVIAVRRRQPGYFRAELTTLHTPTTPARVLARLEQFTAAEVYIPLNDARTAGLGLNYQDPALAFVRPYAVMLRVAYVAPPHGSRLVCWGRLTEPEWDGATGTVRLSAVDQSLPLQHHYVRFGDQALNPTDHPELPNPYDRSVPLDHVGLRMLRDAGKNTPAQTARGVPDLGIRNGTNDVVALPTSTTRTIAYDRGAEVWYSMREHIGHDGAPDMELEPIDEYPYYARLNTYAQQGAGSPIVEWQDGFGADNCTIAYSPGGKIKTHAHVLNADGTQRVTVADEAASEEYGVWVHWDATSYESRDPEPLQDRGKQIVDAHARPLDYFQITPNANCGLFYPWDFAVGSTVRGQIRRGQLRRDMQGRIVAVRLRQRDAAGTVIPELETAVPSGIGAPGIEV